MQGGKLRLLCDLVTTLLAGGLRIYLRYRHPTTFTSAGLYIASDVVMLRVSLADGCPLFVSYACRPFIVPST